MILNDKEITALCNSDTPMIFPFHDKSVKEVTNGAGVTAKTLSFGLSSFGYDVSIAPELFVFSSHTGEVIDPKKFNPKNLLACEIHTAEDGSEYGIIPPNGYMLGHTLESFDIPRDVMVTALGKSTMARVGIMVNVTPIEAGFKGTVVLELANQTPSPVRIYVNEGIAQFLFFKGNDCEVSYGDRAGKYQSQNKMTFAKV